MKVQFFMAMIPPTKTYQEKKVAVVKGKPVFYEPPEVKAVREKLAAHLSHYAPKKMLEKFWAEQTGIFISIEDL